MRVLLTKPWILAGLIRQAGETLDVEEDTARRIVDHGSGLALGKFDGTPRAREIPPPELTGEVIAVEPAEGEVVLRRGAAETRRVTKVDGRLTEVGPDGRVS